MRLLAALLLLSLGNSFAQKKDTILILPGSKVLQSERLKDYTASYEFFSIKDGEEKLVGSLEDRFEVSNKKKLGLRICKISFGPNQILDSGLCELQGLKPVYHRSIQSKKILDLSFNKEKVNGKIISKVNSQVDPIDYQAPAPLFDSYYEDIIAKTVNLDKGVLFRFPEYIYERGGTVWSLGEILKSENPDERVVKFYELNPKKEIIRTTVYVIAESTREIIRREYLTGANKTIMKKKV